MNQASKQSNSNSTTSPTLPSSPSSSSSQSNQNYPHSYLNSNAPAASFNQPFMHNNFSNYQFHQQQPYWNGYGNNNQQLQQPFYPPNYYQNPYNQNFPVNNNRYQQNGYGQPNLNGPPMNMNLNKNNNRSPNNYQNKNNNNFGKRQWNKPNNNNNNDNNNNTNSSKNNPNKSNNNKINKQDLPENNQFNCEVCDRGFKTNQLYEDHCKTHTTCGHNGCTFTAAAKLVKIHFTNFHASGIDKKIPRLETPEEIQKYINERKKNFPTNSNLDKKIKLDNEKIERGITLETRQFGRFNKTKHQNQHTTNTNIKDSNENQLTSTNEGTVEKSIDQNDDHIKPVKQASTSRNNTLNKRIKKKNKKNKCLAMKSNLSGLNRKPTLLQQLLANEIRHERNIILQCVKYVVENNFFDQTNCNLAGVTENKAAGEMNSN